MSAGFNVFLEFTGGFAPEYKHLHTKIPPFHLGPLVRSDFAETPRLMEIIDLCEKTCRSDIDYEQLMDEYRQDTAKTQALKEKTLSYEFWSHIYMNLDAARNIVDVVQTTEQNEKFTQFVCSNPNMFNAVAGQIKHFRSNRVRGIWATFFDDIWDNNNKLEPIKENADWLDMGNPKSVVWTPMRRPDLEAELKKRGLHKFFRRLLDPLYELLDRAQA